MDRGTSTNEGIRAKGRPTNRDLAIVVVVCLVMLAAVVAYLVASGSAARMNDAGAVARDAFASGQIDKAVTSAEIAVKAGAGDTTTLNLLAQAREAAGDLDGALHAYEQSLKADPDQPLILHQVAVIAVSREDFVAAETALRKALAADAGLVGSRLLLADVLAKTGRIQDARSHYQAVIDASPAGVDIASVQAKIDALPR